MGVDSPGLFHVELYQRLWPGSSRSPVIFFILVLLKQVDTMARVLVL